MSLNNSGIKLAGIVNVIFWSLVACFMMFADLKHIKPDKESIALFFYLSMSMIFANGFVYFLLYFPLHRFKWGGVFSYLLSNVVVSIVFLTNFIFVLIFGKQLGWEGIVMMLRGWQGGELGDFTSVVLNIVLGLFFYLVVFFIFFRIMDRVFRGFAVRRVLVLILLPMIAIFVFVLHFQLLSFSESSWKMEQLKYKIPWQASTGFPEDKIRITNEVSEGEEFPDLFVNPPELGQDIELENITALKKKFPEIMELDLKAEKPMNILFVQVEGLRYDMLNPETTRNFYHFCEKKGVNLKKHYTTGNNTPGSQIGLFTGLSPFYSEELRNHSVPTYPLEILKKIGYRQSIYYNSPKYYEYVYRDFLERTEGKFVKIPGRYEDYAPREEKLIQTYLDELEKDTSKKPRFDYYLVNVTHFNYYYPPEFEKFKPAFTMKFEIISGKQKKFEKHKEALMNRYKNSILYFDHLFQKLITELEKMGRLENTIIAITGDHGEEFWEHGSFGHTWGLNNKQIQTSACIYWPGIQKKDIRYKYTSHQDFFPTTFDLIGLNLDSRIFMTGKSLLDYKEERDYAVSSLGVLVSFRRNDYAIMGNGYKILFKNNKNLNDSPYAIYDDDDRVIEKIDPYLGADLLKKTIESKQLDIQKDGFLENK